MKKKFQCCFLTLTLVVLWSLPVHAAGATAGVYIDGALFEAACPLERGTTYVPMRAFLDAVGSYTVWWDGGQRAAAASSSENAVLAPIGSRFLTVNGVRYEMDSAIYIKNGVTYVPLRIFAGALGYDVRWDSSLPGAAVRTGVSMERYPYTENDLYWLARIIHAESRGESLAGQIAVGNVVLNRVRSDEYPDTIYDVIFDDDYAIQFEPVANGTIYNTPSTQSVTAAKLALRGNRPVEDCMYFYAPALSTGAWINANCTYYTTIGCHRFYR